MTGPPYDAETLQRWDDAHVWHPFTPHSVYRDEDPLMVVAGEGHELIDVHGRRYLDGVGSLWCNLYGHQRPEVDQAIQDQLGRIAHATFLGNASAPGVELAHRLAELAPGDLSRVFYSDSGSTAVEVALKIALQFWQQDDGGTQGQRRRFLAFGDAYHGDTVGAVSVGGMDLFHARFAPLLFEVVRCRSPFSFRPPDRDPESWLQRAKEDLAATLKEHGPTLAAVVLEPGMQGAAGMLTQPPGYVRAVRDLCDEHGVLLILDEVAMGMGRSGRLFASETEDVVPDLLCLAKGLTAGYLPLAATLANERIFQAFLGPPEEGRTFFHGHTYTGNALGAAAAMASLDVFESERLLERLPERIAGLGARLERLRALPHVSDIRQYGLSAGVELQADPERGIPFNPADRKGMTVCRRAGERGVFLRPLGDVVVLMPPLTLSDDELDRLVDGVEAGIRALTESPR
ncbi:MAG: adenosylmethionine--8-amino-7-oxononanoate transaminase [Myxococcota bacterium]|nr:adenosylmethionine--8-amino-7-oxononanoate transaminase [Myxococcota bacterium]MEE2780266.1 adenosylmethionine--8-amino-7-oxononanoate transaminase [Myxococcota bacterium]